MNHSCIDVDLNSKIYITHYNSHNARLIFYCNLIIGTYDKKYAQMMSNYILYHIFKSLGRYYENGCYLICSLIHESKFVNIISVAYKFYWYRIFRYMLQDYLMLIRHGHRFHLIMNILVNKDETPDLRNGHL